MVKIIDIISPNTNKNDTVRIVKKEEQKTQKKFPKIFASILLFIIIGLGTAFFIEGKGNIVIYPVLKDVNFEETIQVVAGETEINYEKNILPGEYFEEKLNFEDTYEATGSDESATKAQGKITVCNEHSNLKPLKLIKDTRFLSAEGELTYRATEAFTIPAKNGNNPGCIEVPVIADEAGDRYNLTSATFSIPGLKNTDYYTTIWGEIKEGQKIEGGSVSEQRIITEKDIDKAKDLFEEKYLELAKQSLISNSEAVGTYIYSDNWFEQQFDKFIVLGSKGDKVSNFKIEATITTRVLIFRKSDVDKYIENKLLLSQENRSIVPDSLLKEFVIPENDSEKNTLLLKVNAKTYSEISKVLLINDVKGQEIEDCKNILKNIPEIKSVDVFASLFWKNKLPSNKENINIQIEFEQ
ncbi:MAG TPA: hypothetical protein PKU93_02395 [Candidatus Pacearchaeota archaeon]|nr:hypothetical protein [Candidatus Pacearchaeota archaeon]